MRPGLAYILAALLLGPPAGFGGPFEKAVNSPKLAARLQAGFDDFPLLEPARDDDDKPAFQTLKLKSPLNFNGVDIYGFRFKVEGRKGREDLVWAFLDYGFCTWYIVPETGRMDGFENYFYKTTRAYENLDGLFPVKAKEVITQRLSGDSLEDGKYYLIWMAFKSHRPKQMSVKYTFANVPEKKAQKPLFLERVLGLQRKQN